MHQRGVACSLGWGGDISPRGGHLDWSLEEGVSLLKGLIKPKLRSAPILPYFAPFSKAAK